MPVSRTIEDLGSRPVSDLIENDIKIAVTGSPDAQEGAVTGTVKYVEGWTEFSPSAPDQQEGNFFPFTLSSKYAGKEITVIGKQTKKAYDTDWILRLSDGTNSTFTFQADGRQIIKLTFTGATLKQKGG